MRELTTSELAHVLGVKIDNLRKWKTRGFLRKAPQGVPGQGRSVECMWGQESIEEARELVMMKRTKRLAENAA